MAAVAACLLALAPWGWGGVVFWVVAAALGLGAAAFVAAWAGRRGQLVALGLWTAGIVIAVVATAQSSRGSDEPGLLPLIAPAHPLIRDPWFEALAFPVAAAVGQLLAWAFLGAAPAEPAAGRRLRGSLPFWAGIAFAAYVAVQSWNAFGTVVERDLFWRIVPESPWSWLPSGLRAPLRSDETDPGAMNGWRLLMILGGPWFLFCALRAAAVRRRVFVLLAWVSVVVAAVFALWGFLNQPTYGEILGFPIPRDAQVYGTFINRNHAGVYLYLNAGLAIALGFWHLRRAGDVALRGGPHLLAAFAAMMLALFASLSQSVGSLIVIALLILSSRPSRWLAGSGATNAPCGVARGSPPRRAWPSAWSSSRRPISPGSRRRSGARPNITGPPASMTARPCGPRPGAWPWIVRGPGGAPVPTAGSRPSIRPTRRRCRMSAVGSGCGPRMPTTTRCSSSPK